MEINGQTFVLKIFRRFIAVFGQFGAGFLYRKALSFRGSRLLGTGGVLIAEKKEEILLQPFFLSVPENGLRVFQRGPAAAIDLQNAPFFKRRIRQLFVGFPQYAYLYPVHAVVSQLSQTFPLGLTAPHGFPEIIHHGAARHFAAAENIAVRPHPPVGGIKTHGGIGG